ncbi:MAG: VTT domain-containing protein [Candidatus Eisenbacteria bacterium]|nr:VTT domain-containing protein [Candidatus Eisenbacteria bacterium]
MEFLHDAMPWLPSIGEILRWGGVLAITAIIFSETGLLIGFFLPGDSLLVTAGVFAANGDLSLALLLTLVPLAAVAGDAVGYQIGKRAGQALYSRPDSRFFKRKHLERAHAFYEKYGGKTIVIARFVPIIRTFAPTVAGAARMGYKRFATFNVAGGIGWVVSMVLLGYFLGRSIPDLEKRIHYVIAIVILLSLVPAIVEMLRARRENARERRQAKEARAGR